jgi:hypothetical protein
MVKTYNTAVQAKKRILAFDILRGFFLIVILINHIELYPNFFDLFTGRGRLLVSAAEGFFFMSGLLVGMVYKRRIALGMKFIFKKMWKRAFVLYLASVFFTLLFTFLRLGRFLEPLRRFDVPGTICFLSISQRPLETTVNNQLASLGVSGQ